jgi:alginate O-acetyltransferase complex protein AlgI
MVFSSPIFLFLFLPIALLVCSLPGLGLRNAMLLLFSVLFYAWGEPTFVWLMIGSVLANFLMGLWVGRSKNPRSRKFAVAVAVTLNTGTLAFFKYANFLVVNLNAVLGWLHFPLIHAPNVRLPIGISFFTFHALSYVMDIYRRKWPAAKKPWDVALYIFFFPQLIAGPILRWNAIAPQLASRVVTRSGFAEGVHRFVYGLAKKMIIANVVASPVDKIFALPNTEVTPSLAWFAGVCYMLQIYFDFSGYSDMAVGLGKMFGFEFIENFNFPYISKSVQEFWRRWHISLSSWFRDYLYIPLGGNRCSPWRVRFNLITVFFLCGLWHGASWTFVVWGLYHGFFLILERTRFGRRMDASPAVLQHAYTLAVVIVGWVVFRADTFLQAFVFLKNMIGLTTAPSGAQIFARYWNNELVWAIVLGVIFSMPIQPLVQRIASTLIGRAPKAWRSPLALFGLSLRLASIVVLFLVCASWLAAGTYNPFIYFRF